MKRSFVMVLVAVLTLATAAFGKVVDGIDFPDTVDVAGTRLVRNGIGARTVMFVRFYLAAVYVEQTTTAASGIIGPDRAREVRIAMVKDVSKQRFQEAAHEGFQRNTPSPSESLTKRMKQFLDLVPPLGPGDTLTFTYVPGTGTTIKGNKVKATLIEGKDFADALFNIWLGGRPADDALKQGLLGKTSL